MLDMKKILVGVDLLQIVKESDAQFAAPVEQAIEQAIWLAGKTAAKITFFAAVESVEAKIGDLPAAGLSITKRIEERGQATLRHVVERATRAGVTATSLASPGKAWVELTREAIRGGYDLSIVGARDTGAVGRLLFGSTSTKLVHNCPTPVWVTRTGSPPAPTRLLVASDFTTASDSALRWAIRLAALTGASIDVVHVFISPFARLWEAGLLEAGHETAYHNQALADARRQLQEQVASATGGSLPAHIKTEVIEGVGNPDAYLLECIKQRQIDLLVMGTMARSGVPGVLIGNTAERLLHQAECSLLAIKPADFTSPI